ncbi:hypothetical protein KI387_038526, partial [Taxus chinensis]
VMSNFQVLRCIPETWVSRFNLLEDLVTGLVEVEAKWVGAEVGGVIKGAETEGRGVIAA